jgi:hypothetical protein
MSHSILSLRQPPVDYELQANYEKIVRAPASQQIYRSDLPSQIVIPIADTSAWLRTHQAYLSFELVPIRTNAQGLDVEATGADVVISEQGCTRAIRQLIVRLAGDDTEDIPIYDDLLAHELSTISPEQAGLLKVMQGFRNPQFFQNGRRTCILPIWSSIFLRSQALPLPIWANGGLSLVLTPAPADNLFLNGVVKRFELRNVAVVWQSITPNPSTTAALIAATSGNRPAYLPTQRVHVFQQNGNGSFQQQIQAQIGVKRSIVSVDVYFYREADYADPSKDKFMRFIPCGLKGWRIESGNLRVPDVGEITHSATDPTALVTMLMSQNNSIHQMSSGVTFPDGWDSKHFSIRYNFQAAHGEMWATGLNLLGASHPYLTVFTSHNEVVGPDVRIVCVVVTDQQVTFVNSEVQRTETAF